MKDRIVVISTVGSAEEGERIAAALVEERLVSCVNVVPGVVSFYRWKGEVQEDAEALLILKTQRDRFEPLRDRILALHPYEVPEVLVLPVEHGHDPYLDWVREQVEAGP